ncbi:MAG: DUF6503 family protein [Bacteroidota bacterium]
MTKYIFYLLIFSLAGCGVGNNPQKIVDKAIEVHGGELFLNSTVEFDFRDRHYVAFRNGGTYRYERIWRDSTGSYRDVLSNDGFYREVEGAKVDLPDSMAAKYTRSVNSVVYFALLPYGLNDAAVRKKWLGETTLKDQPYYKIEVTFAEEGGGEDHTDVFHYWIHQEKFTVDYLAYLYHTDGGGIRFREAINPRNINGMLLQDYINYEPPSKSASLDEMEELFRQGSLKELSRIALENISVK